MFKKGCNVRGFFRVKNSIECLPRFAPILEALQRTLFNDQWFLDVDKVKKWSQGIVSKIMDKIKFTRDITEVST